MASTAPSGSAYGDTSPASNYAAVTPHASTEFTYVCRYLYVGTAGNLVAVTPGGSEVTFANVPAGTLLPIKAIRVDDTSTASDIVALW